MKESTILGWILGVCLILIVVSLSDLPVEPPDDWLQEWTTWVTSVVATVVGARVLWRGTDAVIDRLKFREKK